MSKLHLGVLGSGAGSNMQSIVDAIEAGTLDADIKLVLADVPDAKILDRAKKHNIPCQYLDCAPWKTKLEGPAEDLCIDILREAGVDTVVLAGFMRIVKPKLLGAFPNRVVNIHPARLSFFCRCENVESVEREDVMADKPVQCFVGSRSAWDNLRIIPLDKFPALTPLRESDLSSLTEGLEQAMDERWLARIREMVWRRWNACENLRYQR